MAEATVKTYHSFGGTDIHAVFGDEVFGELQMVSYKTDREKAPVYTMGSADLRTIARGKRLTSGACVFIVFDRDSLLDIMNKKASNQPHLDKTFTANSLDNAAAKAAVQQGGSVEGQFDTSSIGLDTFTSQTDAKLVDQLLPFDITLVGANEYGQSSKMTIHGVELMSEAGGISIDDLVIEKQMSFIARRISNWTPITGS
jgi:hypothetical protein